MTANLRPYPEYKESGLPWLGRIPAHWDVGRNGRLFAQRNENGFGELPILEVSLRTGVRVRDMENLKRKQMMSDREKYKRAALGDIAYNMMRMWQGAVGVAPVDGLVSPAYVVAQPYSGTESRYFTYLFRTNTYMNEVDGYSRGIVKDRNRLYWEDFKRMPSCMPPHDEQKAIASYLDSNAIKVRQFIRNRRRLIEVLNEQKQAIVNRAVTRGIDPNVRLKPSGIDWIGDIPEDWQAMRLKRQLVLNDGGVWGSAFSDDGVIVLRSTEQTVDGHWRIVDPAKRVLTQSERAGSLLKSGDLLVTKSSGSPAHIGKTTLVTIDIARTGCCFSNFMQRLRPRDGIEPRYVWYVLNAPLARRQLQYLSNSTTGLGNLSGTILGNIWIAVPTNHEQSRLLKQLVQELQPFEHAIANAKREIDLIREYRTRLIYDAVTGKLDVLHVSPEIGGELVEPVDLDEDISDEELLEDEEPELDDEVTDANDEVTDADD